MGIASIIDEILFQEYNVYYRTIRERVDGPNRMDARGQEVFRNSIFGGGLYRHGSYYSLNVLS
jgi:hypothetical protein